MIRRIVTALAVLVLLLVPLLWLRGATRADGVAIVSPAGNLQAIGHHRGRVLIFASAMPVRPAGQVGGRAISTSAEAFDAVVAELARDRVRVDRWGVRCVTGDSAGVSGVLPRGGRVLIVVPLWVICAGVAIVIVAPAIKRRPRAGHCRQCGYDLRGSSGSERCPECGTVIPEENSLATPLAGG